MHGGFFSKRIEVGTGDRIGCASGEAHHAIRADPAEVGVATWQACQQYPAARSIGLSRARGIAVGHRIASDVGLARVMHA